MTDNLNISSAQLKSYMQTRQEKDYLLIDVRQPREYAQGHIPGGILLPLPELEKKYLDLPSDRDLIFYCHSGGRSAAAGLLVKEARVTQKNIHSLAGGILAWNDKVLPDFPETGLLDRHRELPDLLMAAMNLEKGALRFYGHLIEKLVFRDVVPRLRDISAAETGHARMLYDIWRQTQNDPPDFETLLQSLEGEIIEGGQSIADTLHRLAAMPGEECLNLLELALYIEYTAYDLYRNAAEYRQYYKSRDALLSIAQAEKGHIRQLVALIAKCPE